MSETNDQDRKAVVNQSADLMTRVQNGEMTGQEAFEQMLANPQTKPFTIGD
ncbi:hypothetical protein ACVDFE_00305 [Lentzea chajnantorensis]